MKRRIRWRILAAGLATLLLGSAAQAETTRYFYDGMGRLSGTTADRTQIIAHYYDGADNQTGLHAKPTILSNTGHTLQSGAMVLRGQPINSDDGRFMLQVQEDGNVVLWDTSNWTVVWQTNTPRTQGAIFLLEPDGNLVLYDPQFHPLWATNTSGHPGAQLSVQSDSNLVLYDGGTPIWTR